MKLPQLDTQATIIYGTTAAVGIVVVGYVLYARSASRTYKVEERRRSDIFEAEWAHHLSELRGMVRAPKSPSEESLGDPFAGTNLNADTRDPSAFDPIPTYEPIDPADIPKPSFGPTELP